MAMQTGENEQALRKILDMTRLIAIVVLFIHCYYYCYSAFEQWGIQSGFTDRLLGNIQNTGLFYSFYTSKLFALVFLGISLIGAKGRKNEKLRYKTAVTYILIGLSIYFISHTVIWLDMDITTAALVYMGITVLGYLMILSGGTLLSRIIKTKLSNQDIFNREDETFPQEERYLENEYSINLPARYRLKDKLRQSWINIINPFRGLMVLGTPGAGEILFCHPACHHPAHQKRV